MFRLYLLICLSIFCFICGLDAQVAPGKYRVYLTDKKFSPFSLSNPAAFLSERSIARRKRQNIRINEQDLPVSAFYVDSLHALGFKILNRSKWFNTVLVQVSDTHLLDTLTYLSFVLKKEKVVAVRQKYLYVNKFETETWLQSEQLAYTKNDYGFSYNQIHLNKGDYLHQKGFTGKGMHIALLDGNFNGVSYCRAFRKMFSDGRLLGVRDFVEGDNYVFDGWTHGMQVLSVIGGFVKDTLIGSAPDASFWLLRSEDENSEYRIEEDNWVAAAEFADSVGVDIINSSLGYSVFDDPGQNYSYVDMNGKTAFISQAADIAFSKGILVFTSAGNEGAKPWHFITAPADAFYAIAVGAVDKAGVYAPFSSVGPSFDKRVKPDVCAMGLNVYHWRINNTGGFGSGTSYASPLMAGFAACLWQAHPMAVNKTIRDVILQSAHNFFTPGDFLGYGIPDFQKADELLNIIENSNADEQHPVRVIPNPFSEYFILNFIKDVEAVSLELVDVKGISQFKQFIEGGPWNNLYFYLPASLPSGMYILHVSASSYNEKIRVVKIK